MKSVFEIFLLGENRWTRLQYSLFRIVLGTHLLFSSLLLVHSLTLPLTVFLAGTAAVFSVLLIFGAAERFTAFVLAGLWALFFGVWPLAPHHSEPLLIYILLAHTELAPTTRGELAEAIDWRMPQAIYSFLWFITILFFTYTGVSILFGVDYPLLTTLYLAAPLGLMPRFRPLVWALTLFVALYLIAALGDIVLSLLLVQFFLFDPKWVPGKSAGTPETIFYDGHCGLCHRAVLFALEEDRSGELFRFSPLGGDTFLGAITPDRRAELPDSIVVVTASGELLTKSRAVAHIGMALGGLWRLGAVILRLIPHGVADLGYDLVARYRKRIFRAPDTVCPLIPEQLAARFLP